MYDIEKAHYIAVTGIVLNKDKKFLLVKRSDKEKNWPGKWTVPGGKLERKDYKHREPDTQDGQWYNICEDVLRREVMEETGIEIENVSYLASLVFERTDKVPALVISMFANHKSGKIKLSNDLTEHVWVRLEEAKKYDLIHGIYEELEMADAYLKGQKVGEWSSKT